MHYFCRRFMKWKRIWDSIQNWEAWPFMLRYLPIGPVWFWYCLKSRSFWFFTPSNPTLTFGGFEGEAKKEMYELLPAGSFPLTIYIQPAQPFEEVVNQIAANGFQYPYCVKPDVGMKGLLFRKIESEKDLQQYHTQMPVEYIVQELVQYELEVSVFYYRYPDRPKGVITGFIQKELMEITGDGAQTVLQLVQNHPKARFREPEMRTKHAAHLQTILQPGQRFYLSYAANLNRGARFINLAHEIDERLHQVFDELSFKGQFYYGRYDIKCASIEDLKNGNNFSILEFNGSGAEPNHVYNAGLTLRQAHQIILQHWKVLYEIGKINDRKGIHYWPFLKGWRYLQKAKQHLNLIEAYDKKIGL